MAARVDFEQLYQALPLALQDAVVSLEGLRLQRRRYGPAFQRVFAEYNAQDTLSPHDLSVRRSERLRSFLAVASHVPYWRQAFLDHGVDIAGQEPEKELAKLPILSKSEVKQHVEAIRNPTLTSDQMLPCHTSGTTGGGLIFWETPQAEMERWANWWRYRRRIGLSLDTWCGYFGGRSLVPLRQTKPPFWRVNRFGRQLMFSAYHLSEQNASAYVAALRTYQVPWLHGYPSILSLLAKFIEDQGLERPAGLRLITVGAESLLPEQQFTIERVFQVPVFEHYGQAEGVANISNCRHRRLHIDEDYSFVELVPLDGFPGMARIVGTNFTNPAFPLFRYDTGDLVQLDDTLCPCGLAGRPVGPIDGRREDFLMLPNGALVGRLDHIFKDLVTVREAQFYQRDPRSTTVRIVKGPGYDDADTEATLITEVRKRLGEELEVNIEYVAAIERTTAGKLRFVVSDRSMQR